MPDEPEHPTKPPKRPRRPEQVRMPPRVYREDMTLFQTVLCAAPSWVLICISISLWLTYFPTSSPYNYVGIDDTMFLIQGIVFCAYFLVSAIIARAAYGWVIALLLLGVVFPFWGSMFLWFAGGAVATIGTPVAWLTCTMFAFTFSWRKHAAIGLIALAIFSIWSALLYLFREPQLFFMLDIGELIGMATFWHCLCALVCAQGINERRRFYRTKWREYVRYRPACPSCRYRFRGLPKTSTLCPECGSVIPIWVREAAPERPAQAEPPAPA